MLMSDQHKGEKSSYQIMLSSVQLITHML